MGGLGKTQLASSYCHYKLKSNYYEHVIWLHADQILIQMEGLVKVWLNKRSMDLDEKTIKYEFYQHLKRDTKKKCLVIDNAHDEKSIETYLPSQAIKSLDIILTSRFK